MICKPLKLLVLTGAVLGGAGFLFLGSGFPSYVKTVASSVREKVVGQIPVDLELKRAEGLIRQIEPQIDSCKLDVARSEVELDRLHESVTNLEKVVDTEGRKLQSGARMLSGDGNGEARLAADHLSRRRVEIELQRTLDSYNNNVAILKTKKALIDRQVQAVEVAKQRLAAVRAEKEALEDQIRSLKVQQQQIEAMAASSRHFDLDDSALSRAKEVLAQVRDRLDVAQKMLERDMVLPGDDVPVASAPARDVLKEIQAQFGAPTVVSIEMAPAHR